MHTTSDTPAREDGSPRRAEPAHTARPVFVDASGRRQRRVRRFGRLLVIPAVGYVTLLLSTALGGPTVSSPYLPLPEAGGHPAGVSSPPPGTHKAPNPAADTPTSGARRTAGTGTSHAQPVTGGTPSPAAPRGGSATPTGTVTSAATATATVTHGKSTAGHPAPSHTSHGHQ